MVKYNIAAAVRRHAAYDAIERTLTLSQKPHVGAELIPVFQMQKDVFGDLEAMQSILNQRSIYDRLDSFSLRDSAGGIRHATSANLVRLERHWTEDEASREIAADLHNKLSRLPLDQSSAQSRNLLDLQPLLSQRELKQLVKSVVKISQASHHTKIVHDLHGFKNKTLLTEQISRNWKVEAASCTTKTGRFQKISLCTACGYGTAPVWYQQSMENGPPRYTKQPAFPLKNNHPKKQTKREQPAGCINIQEQ
jgi:hypothetical protein